MQLACQPQPIEMKRRESAESRTMLDKMTNDKQKPRGETLRLKVGRFCSNLSGCNKPNRKVPWNGPEFESGN